MSRQALRCLPSIAMILILAACGGGASDEAAPAGDSLEMERETIDGVEHVRNLSGSVWGAPALLVEELSIGVLEGDEPYMFGRLSGVSMSEDRIYLLDTQVPAVRAFDMQGQYLHDIGKAGQGPGEYSRPFGMAVDYSGRVWVHAGPGQGTNVYSPEGELLGEWRPQGNTFSSTLIPTPDGQMYTSYFEMPETSSGGGNQIRMVIGGNTQGLAPIDLESGGYGEPIYPPETDWEPTEVSVSVGGNTIAMPGGVYEPSFNWAMNGDGTMVSGVADRYAFEVTSPEGAALAVERYWEAVPLDPAEGQERIDQMFGGFMQRDPEWEYPAEIPPTKPAYTDLAFDRSNRIWVTRSGVGVLDRACQEAKDNEPEGSGGGGITAGGNFIMIQGGGGASCWNAPAIRDVFDLEGRYLGEVVQPEGLRFVGEPWIEDDVMLVAVEDEDGTLLVKKYRIVTPTDT